MTDKELQGIYAAAIRESWLTDFDGPFEPVGLRAVEAAARADQIEKDAAIVEGNLGRNWVIRETPRDIAAAIRAQLEGTTDE